MTLVKKYICLKKKKRLKDIKKMVTPDVKTTLALSFFQCRICQYSIKQAKMLLNLLIIHFIVIIICNDFICGIGYN